jgi:NH3-dependent NAD+ synthetase
MTNDERIIALTQWIRHTAADARELLVPVSGGSDSALCFWLCCQAFPDKTVGIHAGTALRSQNWFDSVGNILRVKTPGAQSEREEMRWARFLAASLRRGAWLVGSRNRTEDRLGTYSLASRLATILPLVNVWKSEVMDLCADVGVPQEILESSRRADPDCGRPQELAEIPFVDIERVLRVDAGDAPPETLLGMRAPAIAYVRELIRRNAFKKTLPIRGRTL